MKKILKPFIWICSIPLLIPNSIYAKVSPSLLDVHLIQVRVIKGKVVDRNNIPMASVNVSEVAGPNRVQTDINGEFNLQISEKTKSIRLQFLGYNEQIIALDGQTDYQVTLSEKEDVLDEVIVVGYGTQKKENLTGAVGVIDSKAFEAVPVQNAVQALQGRVPGLNITSSQGGGLNQRQAINVRGVGTIGQGSNGSALILIDGMEGDLYTLNPQDIETISVLKDAASSSIYGSRAPFGVILVTTKKGKQGKIEVNYNNSFRFSSPINMPRALDSYTFSLLYNDAAQNSGWGPYNWISQERLQRIKDYMEGKITTSTIPNPSNPNLWGDGYSWGNDNIDYYDYFFKDKVPSQEHNLNFAGGTEKFQYYLSANYLDEDGQLEIGDDHFNRYTVSSKINAKLSKIVSVGYNSRFVRSDFRRPSHLTETFFGDIGRQSWPTKPLFDPNGNLFDDHALLMRDGGSDKERNTWLYQQVNITIEPIKGWRLIGDVNYRYNTQFKHGDYLTVYQTTTDGNSKGNDWNRNTLVQEKGYSSDYFNVNLYTDYELKIAEAHTLKGLLGFQAEQNNYKDLFADRVGIIYPGKPTINTSNGFDSNGNKVAPNVSGDHSRWSTAGFFGRLNYDYLEKYLLEANLRYDGSSRFRSTNRWGLFPSASVGWNVAREDFFQTWQAAINTFKLRGSYGSLGNQNTSSIYPTYSVMGAGVGRWIIDGTPANIAWAPGLVSYDLGWERINNWNIGLDLGMLANRLTVSLDYYVRNTNNMVGPAEKLPVILGTAVPNANNTDLKTTGFELDLSWRDQLKTGMGYSIRATLSDSRTEITRYSNPSGLMDGYYNRKKLGEIWGYNTLGIAKTNEEMQAHLANLPNGGQNLLGQDWQAGDIMYHDKNGDGKIDGGSRTLDNHGDLEVIGNSTPNYNFGLELGLSWKGFDLRMFWQGTLKRDFYQGSYYFWGINGNQGPWFSTAIRGHEDYFRNDPNHPLGDNTDSYYPRPLWNSDKNQQTQTKYLQNAAYARLKNLQLGYSLSSNFIKKIGIKKLRIFASGENLLTITNLLDLFDPESIGGGNWGHGNVYPLSKTYALGLNVTL